MHLKTTQLRLIIHRNGSPQPRCSQHFKVGVQRLQTCCDLRRGLGSGRSTSYTLPLRLRTGLRVESQFLVTLCAFFCSSVYMSLIRRRLTGCFPTKVQAKESRTYISSLSSLAIRKRLLTKFACVYTLPACRLPRPYLYLLTGHPPDVCCRPPASRPERLGRKSTFY